MGIINTLQEIELLNVPDMSFEGYQLQMQSISNDIDNASRDIDTAFMAVTSLESLVSTLSKSDTSNISQESMFLYQHARYTSYALVGLPLEDSLSLEDYSSSNSITTSLEDDRGVIIKIWDGIMKMFKWIFDRLADFWKFLFGTAEKVEKKVKVVKEEVKKVVKEGKEVFEAQLTPDEARYYGALLMNTSDETKQSYYNVESYLDIVGTIFKNKVLEQFAEAAVRDTKEAMTDPGILSNANMGTKVNDHTVYQDPVFSAPGFIKLRNENMQKMLGKQFSNSNQGLTNVHYYGLKEPLPGGKYIVVQVNGGNFADEEYIYNFVVMDPPKWNIQFPSEKLPRTRKEIEKICDSIDIITKHSKDTCRDVQRKFQLIKGYVDTNKKNVASLANTMSYKNATDTERVNITKKWKNLLKEVQSLVDTSNKFCNYVNNTNFALLSLMLRIIDPTRLAKDDISTSDVKESM